MDDKRDVSNCGLDKVSSHPYGDYKIRSNFARKIISWFYWKFNGDSRNFLLKSLPKNSICAEIGIFKGDFTKQILKTVKPNLLHLIDIDTSKLSSELKSNNQLKIHEGDSKNILNEFDNNYFDWVYIDGDHSYAAVKLDLELCLRKVKKNGFITGDDYENHYFGVIKAVTEFLDKNTSVALLEIKETQFILQKR